MAQAGKVGMDYSIRFVGRRVEVSASRHRYDGTRVLTALRGCRDGACGCTTPFPAEIGAMSATASNDQVIVELSPRPGVTFDRTRVMQCVECCLEKSRVPPQARAAS